MLYDPKWEAQIDGGTNSIRDILIRARRLIEREEHWCSDGMGDGRTRCAIHAINMAQGAHEALFTDAQEFVEQKLLRGGYLGVFNDTHNHAEVLALFSRAIAIAPR